MHKRIFNAEIFYIFGKAKPEETELIFAALVEIEDAIKAATAKRHGRQLGHVEIAETLNPLLEKTQLQAVQNFTKRLLQVDSIEANCALDVAINHVFTTTNRYSSMLGNHKQKSRGKQ